MEPLAVVADNAGRFLAAMLEGVESEGGDGCRVGVAVDAEYAAFFAEPVGVHFLVQECHLRFSWSLLLV